MVTTHGCFVFFEAIFCIYGIYIALKMLNWYDMAHHLEHYGVPFDEGCPRGWKFILPDLPYGWCFYKTAENAIVMKTVLVPYVLIWCLSQCYATFCVLCLKFDNAMICLSTFLICSLILFNDSSSILYYPLLSYICIEKAAICGTKLIIDQFLAKTHKTKI